MKIKKVIIQRNYDYREFIFDDKINLIYSKENSKGKTTLLRAILFGLGYNIPATDGIKTFDDFYIHIDFIEKFQQYSLERKGDIVTLNVETLEKIERGIAPREKQGEDFTLAPMLSKDMAKINWEEMNAEKIKNLVRGLNPIMGAYSELEGKKVKFWKVNVVNLKDLSQKFPELKEYEYRMNGLAPGTVLFADEKNGLYINAIDGIIKVLEIQGENAKKMLINDYLRGNKIQAGTIFE